MLEVIKSKVISLLESLHRRIFGHPMSDTMKVFLANLSWSFLGGGIASVIILAINILAGRLMGPEQYGKYSLALVVSNYLVILFFCGIDIASVRAIAKSKDRAEIRRNISSSAYFVFFTTGLISILALIFATALAGLFSTNPNVIRFAILLAVFPSLKLLFDGYIRGIHQFKRQFLGRMIEVLAIVILFVLLFFVLKRYTFDSYVIATAGGALAIFLSYLPRIVSYLGSFDKKALFHQLSLGKLFLLSSMLDTIFISIDKLVINRYLDIVQLGIYMAYFMVAMNLTSQISQMFNNVLMPTVAKTFDRSTFAKLEKIIKLAFLPTFLVITAIVYVTILLFGSKYGLAWYLVISFGIFGLLKLLLSTYNTIITTLPKTIYKRYIFNYNLINIVTAALYALIIIFHQVSLLLVIGIQIFNIFALILVQKRIIRHNFKILENIPVQPVIS